MTISSTFDRQVDRVRTFTFAGPSVANLINEMTKRAADLGIDVYMQGNEGPSQKSPHNPNAHDVYCVFASREGANRFEREIFASRFGKKSRMKMPRTYPPELGHFRGFGEQGPDPA